jgi:L-asparaginase
MSKHVALISTGGTIEKTYDELAGILHNRFSVLDVMLSQLQLRGVAIERLSLMNKDSLEMSEADHELIVTTTARRQDTHVGIVIVHRGRYPFFRDRRQPP